MQRNQITNAVGWSFVGGPTLLGAIRWLVQAFGDAQTAAEMFVLVRGVDINWVSLAILAVVVGFAILGVENWRSIIGYVRARKAREVRKWHQEVKEALEYIAYNSVLWKSATPHTALDVAIKSFIEAAQSGKLKAGGRLPGGGLPISIKPHVWRDYKIHKVSTPPAENRNPHIREFGLLKDAGSFLFEAIMVDKDEIQALWPPMPNWRI